MTSKLNIIVVRY